MNKILLSILFAFPVILSGQEKTLKDPFQLIPELYPPVTINVGFHFVHKYSVTDTFNIPDNEIGTKWWNDRIDSINRILSNPAEPNHAYHKGFSRDYKVRINNVGMFHHVDSNYWVNAGIHQFYNRFVRDNESFGKFEKDSVLHSYYYGDDRWGGMAAGIPSRIGMRFKGRYRLFWHWNRDSRIGSGHSDHNYVHELCHSMGLIHNFKNNPDIGRDECHGCDAKLGDHCFDMKSKPYAANNIMAKGPNITPWGQSLTLCQQQKILFNLYGYNTRYSGGTRDISMCTTKNYPCSNNYRVSVRDSLILDYDFKSFGSFVIDANQVLVVKSKLEMPAGSRIKVKRGAVLIVDGGLIMSNPDCGSSWDGLELAKGSWFWWLKRKEKRKLNKGGQVQYLNAGSIN